MVNPTIRKVGSADVTSIGYGAMGLSVFYGTPLPDQERLKVRRWFSTHAQSPFNENHFGWSRFLTPSWKMDTTTLILLMSTAIMKR